MSAEKSGTAKFEEKLQLVENGRLSVDEFVAEYEAFIRTELDKLFEMMTFL